MNASRPWKKVAVFGLLGAFGCLLGWALGEGLLAAALPARGEDGTHAPSLASRPEAPKPAAAPKLEPPARVAPPPPAAPVLPKLSEVAPPAPVAAAVAKREPPLPLPEDVQKLLTEAGGKSGELQFTLVWTNRNDLDLHCIDPNGEQIFYGNNKAMKSGGHLDVDRNVSGETVTPIENIYFPTGTPPGKYRIYVNYFERHDAANATTFKVHTLIEGKRKSFDGTLNANDKGKPKLIHEFVLGERITAPATVVVYPGGKNTFRVQVGRDPSNTDPIKLTFAGAATGVTLPGEVTIPRNQDVADIEVAADPSAKVDGSKVTVMAEGKNGKSETSLQIAVKLPPPALQIAVPAKVVLFPGGKNTFPVRLHRQNNDEPVRLSVTGEADGLTMPAGVTVPGNRNDAELEVAAHSGSKGGVRAIRIVAEGVHGKVAEDCQFIVEIPPASLILAAPESVAVMVGESNRVTVRIARNWFEGPVEVRVRNDVTGLTLSSATIAADRDEAELTVATNPDTKDGTFPVTVTATGGSVSATATINVQVAPIPPPPPPPPAAPAPPWPWRLVLVISLWTALLAIGLSLALVIGQNRHLSRPWLSGREAAVLFAGGGLAGVVAGGIGQTLFALMAGANVMPEIGFLAGWLLLGGLLGRGVGFFIPNLHPWRSALAGVAGGFLGAAAFILISRLGDVPGRFVGAAILGGCIGLMVALVEMAFRRAWLEVRFSGGETITVNLGPEPVKVGGDGRQCAVWARGAAPVALRYWVREGRVLCDDMAGGGERVANNGDRRKAGAVEVVVRTASGGVAAQPAKPVVFTLDDEDDVAPAPTVRPTPPPPPSKVVAPPPLKPVAPPPQSKTVVPPPPRPVASPVSKPVVPPAKPVAPPPKPAYTCSECGAGVEKPRGVCPSCGAMY